MPNLHARLKIKKEISKNIEIPVKTNKIIIPHSSNFSDILIDWYGENKRDLPWRNTSDPYKVWLSEIILQQTRIEQGMPFYEKFLSCFPAVEALANAQVQEVLRLWQGLGYYTRARNLHACATRVVSEYGSVFPGTYHELLQLPGIGPYTAAAIASFCFAEPVVALDGNSIRVLTRYLNYGENMDSMAARRQLSVLSSALIPVEKPGLFNQALMDFGSMVCKSPVPDCDHCPVFPECGAYTSRRQASLPVSRKKIRKKNRYLNYLVFLDRDAVYMRKREDRDIWQGLFEFYLIETKKVPETDRLFKEYPGKILPVQVPADSPHDYKHVLTHQNLFIRFHVIELKKADVKKMLMSLGFQKYTMDQVEQLPKPIIIERFLKEKIN